MVTFLYGIKKFSLIPLFLCKEMQHLSMSYHLLISPADTFGPPPRAASMTPAAKSKSAVAAQMLLSVFDVELGKWVALYPKVRACTVQLVLCSCRISW